MNNITLAHQLKHRTTDLFYTKSKKDLVTPKEIEAIKDGVSKRESELIFAIYPNEFRKINTNGDPVIDAAEIQKYYLSNLLAKQMIFLKKPEQLQPTVKKYYKQIQNIWPADPFFQRFPKLKTTTAGEQTRLFSWWANGPNRHFSLKTNELLEYFYINETEPSIRPIFTKADEDSRINMKKALYEIAFKNITNSDPASELKARLIALSLYKLIEEPTAYKACENVEGWQYFECNVLNDLYPFNIYTDKGFLNSYLFQNNAASLAGKVKITPPDKTLVVGFDDFDYVEFFKDGLAGAEKLCKVVEQKYTLKKPDGENPLKWLTNIIKSKDLLTLSSKLNIKITPETPYYSEIKELRSQLKLSHNPRAIRRFREKLNTFFIVGTDHDNKFLKKQTLKDKSFITEWNSIIIKAAQQMDFFRGRILFQDPTIFRDADYISFSARSIGNPGHIRLEIITDENNDGTYRREPDNGWKIATGDANWSIYLQANETWARYLVPVKDFRLDEHMSQTKATELDPQKIIALQFNAHDKKNNYISAIKNKLGAKLGFNSLLESMEIKNIKFYKEPQ
jgi:hypothetical protein